MRSVTIPRTKLRPPYRRGLLVPCLQLMEMIFGGLRLPSSLLRPVLARRPWRGLVILLGLVMVVNFFFSATEQLTPLLITNHFRVVASLVADKETVFLGSGTTVLEVARNLRERKQLTVVTNSLPVLNTLAGLPEITVISLGGMLRESELSFIGHITEQTLAEIRVDKVIVGTRGLSLEHGLTNDYLQETLTDRAILKIGREVIIVADHTKVNRVATVLLAPLDSMGTFVTDPNADKKVVQALKKQGIQVLVA